MRNPFCFLDTRHSLKTCIALWLVEWFLARKQEAKPPVKGHMLQQAPLKADKERRLVNCTVVGLEQWFEFVVCQWPCDLTFPWVETEVWKTHKRKDRMIFLSPLIRKAVAEVSTRKTMEEIRFVCQGCHSKLKTLLKQSHCQTYVELHCSSICLKLTFDYVT